LAFLNFKGSPLLAYQAQKNLQKASQLLQSGRLDDAKKLAGQVLAVNPNSDDAAHLLALCCKAKFDTSGAEHHFRKAIKLNKLNFHILCNYANFHSGIGRLDEAIEKYQKTVKLNPSFISGWSGMGAAAIKANKPLIAEKAYREIIKLQPNNTLGWHGLGSSLRAQDRLFAAADAFENAVKYNPVNAAAWINLGVVKRLLGDLEASLICFDKAEKAGFNGPELLDGRASILLDQGKPNQSITVYRQICSKFPRYTEGYDALARILYENDPFVDAADILRNAVAGQKENVALHFKLINLLYDMERYDEALEALNGVSKIADVQLVLVASEAKIREGMGEFKQAGELFDRAIRLQPNDVNLILSYVRHLIKVGDIGRANKQIGKAVQLDPNHQTAWGYQGTIWRVLGDTREDWLHGYDKYIQSCNIDIPDAFSSVDDFCQALEKMLRPLHVAKKEPLNQSLRQGSQSSGNLFGLKDPMVVEIIKALRSSLLTQIKQLPDDPSHPFLRKKSDIIRFAGAWSVLLKESGHHINHLHSQGWLSSAFYIALPASVDMDTPNHEGWIQFGQPPLDLGLNLEPRSYIKPQVGSFALFPSYTWHGTVPFSEGTERMTIGYDVLPG
jgi:tetratricopeptide (TPR) repeat protein